MEKLELNQMEVINGGVSCGWAYGGIALAYIGLIAATGPFGAVLCMAGLIHAAVSAGRAGC